MITIVSMRGNNWPSLPWQVKVDRSSPLGNPFALSRTCTRAESCSKYLDWFHAEVVQGNPAVLKELHRLFELYKVHDKLELYCWCAPKQCHAETIKSYLEDLLT